MGEVHLPDFLVGTIQLAEGYMEPASHFCVLNNALHISQKNPHKLQLIRRLFPPTSLPQGSVAFDQSRNEIWNAS